MGDERSLVSGSSPDRRGEHEPFRALQFSRSSCGSDVRTSGTVLSGLDSADTHFTQRFPSQRTFPIRLLMRDDDKATTAPHKRPRHASPENSLTPVSGRAGSNHPATRPLE